MTQIFELPKRSLYTYRRKKDGHIYQVSYTHKCIISKSEAFMFMAENRLWEVIKIEKDI